MSYTSRKLGAAFLNAAGEKLFSAFRIGIGSDVSVMADRCKTLCSTAIISSHHSRSMAKLPSDNPPRVLATKATPTGCIQLILRAHFSGACGDEPVSVDMKRLPERLFGLICYPENNYGEAAAKGIADALDDAIVRAVSSEAKPRGAVREFMTVDMLDSRLLVWKTQRGDVTALRVSNPGLRDRVIERLEDVSGRSLLSPRPAT